MPLLPESFRAPTLADLFLSSAIQHAERPALWVGGTVVSYRELLGLASRVGHALIEAAPAGMVRRCAVLCTRGLGDFVGILGALLARCAYVPLSLRHPPQRLIAAIQAAEIQAFVMGNDGLALGRHLLDAIPYPVLVLLPDTADPPEWAGQMPQHRFLAARDLLKSGIGGLGHGSMDHGAYLLFTSGSTGEPKGILVRNGNVMSYLRSVAARYQLVPEDRCTQLFELTFDLSVHDMFLCWGAGATLYSVPEKARVAPRQFVNHHSLTTWFSVPSTAAVMHGLRELRPNALPTLRLSLFCGEPLPRLLALAWAAAAPNSILENLYGPTEATIAITAFRLPAEAACIASLPETIPIGSPLPGQDAVIVDADGRQAAGEEAGELCLCGSQVTPGYWRLPDLTAQRFVHFGWDSSQRTWYRTGDRAMLTRDNQLLFLGRLDRQVKIAGHRIELAEIDLALQRASHAIAAAIAWPVGPDGLARGIVGFVGSTTQSREAISAACRQTLPHYAVPAAIHIIDPWPLNSNGKTDHARLREIAEAAAVR